MSDHVECQCASAWITGRLLKCSSSSAYDHQTTGARGGNYVTYPATFSYPRELRSLWLPPKENVTTIHLPVPLNLWLAGERGGTRGARGDSGAGNSRSTGVRRGTTGVSGSPTQHV
ncbi:hypothetical protein BDA96_03G155200 [Sorghum bicolor]|uniref:Uncharacterized protein n=1 Tax=Sorghum bicolor TaxID=4558 RepID=A0A921RE74_SORBI|nr:hypothetical protein BDA96_03G155200 [Sorghum bicolor]